MAGETVSFEILARDGASRTFRSVGDEALKTSAKVDAAAASMKLFDDTVQKQGKAAATSTAAMKAHQKAAALLADAENVLGGRATTTTKLMADQGRELEKGASSVSRFAREAENAGTAAENASAGLGAMGGAMPALISGAVALAPVALTLGFGLGGLGIAAAGVVSPIIKASQASGGLAANMSKLDPIQRQAAQGVLALQHGYQGFQASLKPVILSDFSSGLHLAAGLMHDVQPVAKATGVALGGLLNRVDAEFQSGTWQNFFGFMERSAGPDIKLLGDSIISLLHSLPTLAVDLQPAATALLQLTSAAAKGIGGISALTYDLEHLRSSSSFLGQIGSHIPAGNKSIADLFGQGYAWLEQHLPAGNKSISDLLGLTHSMPPAAKAAGNSLSGMGTDAQNAALKVETLDTGLESLLGHLAGSAAAVDSTDAAWQSLGKALATNSLRSLAGRQAYDSYISSVLSGLSALEKNRASGAQVNAYLQTNIDRLKSLGPLNATQKQELAALRQRQDQLAQSTAKLSAAQRTALGQLTAGYIPALRLMHTDTPLVRTDIDRLGAAILNSGKGSDATRSARQKLIGDLELAGVSAKNARAFVNGLQGQINKLHGRSVNVGLTTSGSGRIIITGTGIGTRTINTSTGQVRAVGGHTGAAAAGMLVRGGTPGRDSVLVNTMPGELIVPTRLVQAGAVDHLRGKIPGFAAGGLVGGAVRAENAMGQADVQVGAAAAAAFAKSAVSAARAAAAAIAGPAVSGGGGPAAALFRRMYPGWASGALWNAVNYVAMRESGWNTYAVNPSSGAAGVAQRIQGWASFYQPGNAYQQDKWFHDYMASRYGGPIGAAAHERNFGWYDNGGYLPPGLSLAYNGTGRPEPVIPAGRGGGQTVTVIVQVDPVIASVTPDRKLGQAIGQHVTEAIRGGMKLYPAGVAPR